MSLILKGKFSSSRERVHHCTLLEKAEMCAVEAATGGSCNRDLCLVWFFNSSYFIPEKRADWKYTKVRK